jgi:hypothetical protein
MYTVKSEQFKNRWNFLISSRMDDVCTRDTPHWTQSSCFRPVPPSNPLHFLGIADLLELRLDADR